ncbi:MAG TPA: glycogen-binding domain-containing protein [Longimicrobiales bacterium]|nr:glycogen-binding domain-containing protein [Longimicrobiales bacterium]
MGRSLRCVIAMLALASAGALDAMPLAGQWRLDVQAGRLQYEGSPDATATSLALGLARTSASSEFGMSTGVPFSRQEPVWGALYGFRRFATIGAPLRFGVDLGGNGFAYRIQSRDTLADLPALPTTSDAITGWGAAVEAMPLLSWSRSMLTAEARAGGVLFTTSSGSGAGFDRTAFVADAALVATPVSGLTARLDGRWVSVTDGGFPYAGAGLTWTRGVTLWGAVGKWFDDDITTLSWSAGASLPLAERVSVLVTGRHDALDPVYATPARTTWGAGVSVLLGDVRRAVSEPVPAAYRGGIATIAIEADDAEGRPSIAGDFNGWTPAPMVRRGDAWIHEVALQPGVYSYAFVDPAGAWFVPEDTPGRRDDGMGGHVAVLVVQE